MSGEWSLVCWLANAVWKLTHWGLSGGPWYTPLSSGFNRGNDDQPWIFGALPIFRQSHICYIRIKWLRTCEKYPRGGKGQHQRGCPDTPGSHAIISKYETRNKAAWNSPCGNRGGAKVSIKGDAWTHALLAEPVNPWFSKISRTKSFKQDNCWMLGLRRSWNSA